MLTAVLGNVMFIHRKGLETWIKRLPFNYKPQIEVLVPFCVLAPAIIPGHVDLFKVILQ